MINIKPIIERIIPNKMHLYIFLFIYLVSFSGFDIFICSGFVESFITIEGVLGPSICKALALT